MTGRRHPPQPLLSNNSHETHQPIAIESHPDVPLGGAYPDADDGHADVWVLQAGGEDLRVEGARVGDKNPDGGSEWEACGAVLPSAGVICMSTTYTDLQLKEFLARQLPEEIEVKPWSGIFPVSFYWRDTGGLFDHGGRRVDETSWDYVVRRVEEKLTDEQFTTYLHELWKVLGRPLHEKFSPTRDLWRSAYQPRTIALSQTLNIPIE